MEFKELHLRELKSVYYVDEFGDDGIYDNELNVYSLDRGQVILEFEEGKYYYIAADSMEGGISIEFVSALVEDEIFKVNFLNDLVWKNISSKVIRTIDIIHEGAQSSEIVTIAINFKNGEKIFIANAGYITKGKIVPQTDDLVIFNKRTIGERLNLKVK